MKYQPGNKTNTSRIVQVFSLIDPIREPLVRDAIRALNILPGSQGLDAGCGVGSNTLLLAEAVIPDGRVTGLDISAELLSIAQERAQEAGYSRQVTFRQGDVRALPIEHDRFDWAWSMDLVGYGPLEPMPAFKELQKVIKPGGFLAILAWSCEHLLPGHPRLESLLGATSSGIAPFVQGSSPNRHFLRSLGLFRRAGFEEVQARSFVHGVQAPLGEETRTGLKALFDMRWPGVESELSGEDLAEFERITKPESPEFILNEPDYYAFFTYTMFTGIVPE